MQKDVNLQRFYQKCASGNYILRVVNKLSKEVRIQNHTGIMEDSVNILMNIDDGGKYPRAVTKSGKRISRLAFLCFLHFFLSWMANSHFKPPQRWQILNVFGGLFQRRTYGGLTTVQEEEFAVFRKSFDCQVSVYQEILKKIGSFANRTRSELDKKLKDIARRLNDECYIKVQSF